MNLCNEVNHNYKKRSFGDKHLIDEDRVYKQTYENLYKYDNETDDIIRKAVDNRIE